jgi:hypothetical protein
MFSVCSQAKQQPVTLTISSSGSSTGWYQQQHQQQQQQQPPQTAARLFQASPPGSNQTSGRLMALNSKAAETAS